MGKKDLSSMSQHAAGPVVRNPQGADRFLMADGEMETPFLPEGQGGETADAPIGAPDPAQTRPIETVFHARPSRSAALVAASMERLLPSRFTPGGEEIYGMVAIALDPSTRQELAALTGDRDNSAFVREALRWAADAAPTDVVQKAVEVDRGRRLSRGFARAITCRMVRSEMEILDALGQRAGLKRKPTLEGCVALYLAHQRI